MTFNIQYSTGLINNLNANLDGFSNLLVSEIPFVTGNTKIMPEDFSLSPAYPNPFNPVTTIHFGIPAVESLRPSTSSDSTNI